MKKVTTCKLLSEQFEMLANLYLAHAKTKSKMEKELLQMDIDTMLNDFIPHNIKILIKK